MSAIRLNDEQMRRFICDGVLVLDSIPDASFHQTIFDKVQYVNVQDPDVWFNILPRVSELQQVLDSPTIKGALQSILGNDYMLSPHRLSTPSEPLAPEERNLELKGYESGTPVGEGSRSFTVWHKDKLHHTRYHVPRFLFLFYFPQDTPAERGPTRVIPGSHYCDHITEADHRFAFVPDQIKAGSCLLTAIDIEHAGMSNLTDQTRHMIKFNFMRTRNPEEPSWDGGASDWQPPAEHLGRFQYPETWSYVWDWMRGISKTGFRPAKDVDRHLASLNGTNQQARLAAIYSLGAMGEPTLEPLISGLLSVAGQNRIQPHSYSQKEDGSFGPDGDPLERRWVDGAHIVQDEAYALSCLGEIAIDPLVQLLDHEDPWIVVNAAFALGEIGSPAARAMPKMAEILDTSDDRIIRAVLEAIACISSNTIPALPAISKLLRMPRDSWGVNPQVRREIIGDKIHLNAMNALALSDLYIADMEDLLIEVLEKPASDIDTPATALEILVRSGSPRSIRYAIRYLQAHRWDDTRWPDEVTSREAS
mgnify:CR=1 FL=1|tara:strand:+ start:2755 stop:4356 length:1602 start_codon:yes stop_codon:yes gene_type:complete